jgi:DNA-binding NarL/FixJ family response regulator
MRVRPVVVAHRQAMVAESIAAALASYPSIVPVAVATSASEGELHAEGGAAIALDGQLPGAKDAAQRLRRRGVRVVVLDGPDPQEEDIRVSTRDPVAALASALVPDTSVAPPSPDSLTMRQRQILALVAKGLGGKEVARHLGISPKTVEQHKSRIFAKLGVPNQTAAVSRVLSNGLQKGHPWNRSII